MPLSRCMTTVDHSLEEGVGGEGRECLNGPYPSLCPDPLLCSCIRTIYGIVAAKRDLTHVFKLFKIPLQLIFYTLEIGQSIVELQWPEFLITGAHVNFNALSLKIF